MRNVKSFRINDTQSREAHETQYAIVLAMLTGIGIGALAVQGLQRRPKPPAYVVVDVTVSDDANYQKALKGYGATVGKILTEREAPILDVAVKSLRSKVRLPNV